MAIPISDFNFWKRALQDCTYKCMYTYIKALFENTIGEPGIGIANPFVGMALRTLWKIALPMYIFT